MSVNETLSPSVDAAGPPPRARDGRLGDLWRDKSATVGVIYLVLLVLAATFGPMLLSQSPTEINVLDGLQPPIWQPGGSTAHLLGTDKLGRDMLTRLLYGARTSLLVGGSVVFVAGTFGTVLGILAGYKGGRIDTLIMRVADAQLAFPGLLLLVFVLAVVGPSVWVIIVVLSAFGWVVYARLIRGIVLQLKPTPAILSAQLLGCSTWRIMFRHLLPMLYPVLLTQGMLELARVMLAEASLSYLGLGIQPPSASWGLMVSENQSLLSEAWWTVVLPGLALAITTIAINVVGNWLRVQTDPEQRSRRFAQSRRVRRWRSGVYEKAATSPAPASALPETDSKAPPPLLTVEGLRVTFETRRGPVAAVRDAAVRVAPGETIGIVGESGSGKSSLALSLLNMVPAPGRSSASRITWEGKQISAHELGRLAGSKITMIFQDPMTSLNPLVPVGRQIAEVLIRHRGMSKSAAMARAEELLELVGVSSARDRLKQRPDQLSGGLRQRVMIASALAAEPKLLVADEPTTALDATIQAQILELVAELQKRLGIAVIIITHDLGVVARMCDRVLVMYGGRLVEEAPVFELFARPRHQYSSALLEAIPRVDRHGRRLPTIPGRPPGALEPISGCPFHRRCRYADKQCLEMPSSVETSPASRYACWHPVEHDSLNEPAHV